MIRYIDNKKSTIVNQSEKGATLSESPDSSYAPYLGGNDACWHFRHLSHLFS